MLIFGQKVLLILEKYHNRNSKNKNATSRGLWPCYEKMTYQSQCPTLLRLHLRPGHACLVSSAHAKMKRTLLPWA